MKYIFKHNKDSWSRISKKGIFRYLLVLGVFKLGIVTWFIYKFSTYMYEINYVIENFKINSFLFNFLKGTPFSIIIGLILSYYLWNDNEKRFNTD